MKLAGVRIVPHFAELSNAEKELLEKNGYVDQKETDPDGNALYEKVAEFDPSEARDYQHIAEDTFLYPDGRIISAPLHGDIPEIGDVLWTMHGIRQDGMIHWHAEPMCIEKVSAHTFFDAHGNGSSLKSIGKRYFWSRGECIGNFLKSHGSLEEKIDPNDPIEKILSGEIAKHIEERERTDFEDFRIYPSYEMEQIVRIFAGNTLVPEAFFDWDFDENKKILCEASGKSITLRQISEQYYAKTSSRSVLTVVVEFPLHGEIYQIGNYPEMKWIKHGTTKGYA